MRNPNYFLLIPITLFVGFVWWTQKKSDSVNTMRIIAEQAYKQTDKTDLNTPPEIVLKKGDFHFFEESHTCHVQAKESRIFPNAKKTECIDVICNLQSGSSPMKTKDFLATLRAKKAYINQNDKIIFFPGTITETFKDWQGTKEHAIYNAKKQIVTAHKTTFQSQKHNIFAIADKSMTDIKNQSVALWGNVITIFSVD